MGAGFHVYATQWSATSVSFSVDGAVYWTSHATPQLPRRGRRGCSTQPFFVLLNFAVGGNWPGSPDGTSSFPQHMLVDYVRAYEPSP